jgi:diguanylate cyclase (GGDEF)-like protein
MMADGRSMSIPNMHAQKPPVFLIATTEPALLSRFEAVLARDGAEVKSANSHDSVLEKLRDDAPPALLLIDANLPDVPIEQLLAAITEKYCSPPLVLISDTVTEQSQDWLRAGVVADLVLRDCPPAYWALRIDRAIQKSLLERELVLLRETTALEALHDRLTGVLNRDAILAALLRESDRVQRSGTALALILFDLDDFGHWNSRLGAHTCDELLCQVASRTARMLRSYDLLGRTGKDEFLIGLPGCSAANATTLAERLRTEVFTEPYHVHNEAVRLSACFGIAQSLGRSPVVVLREAEQALARARGIGPESIEYGASAKSIPPPVTFLLPTSGEELLAW